MAGFGNLMDYISTSKGEEETLTVSEVVGRLESLIRRSPDLKDVSVLGEISQWTVKKSGPRQHAYFSIKDKGALLNCVIFGYDGSEDDYTKGDMVVVKGDIGLYKDRSIYQMRVSSIRKESGTGVLFMEYLQLKERLEKEGLFSAPKSPIPEFPAVIGVVTSTEAAALRDIIRTIKERFPYVRIIVSPTQVQGKGAGMDIARAIERINRYSREVEKVDVLIVGRGGGSFEDLYCFNEEAAVRAVHASEIPIITGIGHQTDITLCDMAADRSGPTPTGAAAMAVDRAAEALSSINTLLDDLTNGITNAIDWWKKYVDAAGKTELYGRIQQMEENLIQTIDYSSDTIETGMRAILDRVRMDLEKADALAEATNPINVLRRGYSIVETDGQPIESVSALSIGDDIRITMSDGIVDARVENVEEQREVEEDEGS